MIWWGKINVKLAIFNEIFTWKLLTNCKLVSGVSFSNVYNGINQIFSISDAGYFLNLNSSWEIRKGNFYESSNFFYSCGLWHFLTWPIRGLSGSRNYLHYGFLFLGLNHRGFTSGGGGCNWLSYCLLSHLFADNLHRNDRGGRSSRRTRCTCSWCGSFDCSCSVYFGCWLRCPGRARCCSNSSSCASLFSCSGSLWLTYDRSRSSCCSCSWGGHLNWNRVGHCLRNSHWLDSTSRFSCPNYFRLVDDFCRRRCQRCGGCQCGSWCRGNLLFVRTSYLRHSF